MDRRTFLARAALVGTTTGVAGCLGAGGEGDGGSAADGMGARTDTAMDGAATADDTSMGEGSAATPSSTPTWADGPPFGKHPATRGIRKQPYLGPTPGEATGTIVAFEDPSCPLCKRFETGTLPKIKAELVDTGKATFVFRGYPVVYAWGKPAAQALEAAYARDEAVHWSLLDHYFTNQDRISTRNVMKETRQFVEARTDFDVDAFMTDVEEKAYDGAVQADLAAGDAGGADGITPTLVLFKDGEYRTKARGSVSFSVVKAALGL